MVSAVKLSVLASVGVVLIVLGAVMGWYGFPTIMDNIIEEQMVLTNDSASFEPWQEPTSQIDVYMQFIMFNLTNPEELMAGGKPNVTEVGPFSYKEDRRRIQLNYSDDGTELTYNEVITYTFDAATSGAGLSESTPITTLNVASAVVAAMGDSMSKVLQDLLYTIIERHGTGRTWATFAAGELLMSGAEDQLLGYLATNALFKNLVPPTFADGRFRLYPYNNTVDGPYTIKTGKDDIDQFTHILKYQNAQNLSYWSTDYCNMINGTDGITYPPNTGDVNRVYIFNKDLCRSIYLDYEKDVEYFGIAGRRFSPIKAVLDDPRSNPDNECFCVGECLKAGVMSLSPCQYGAPIVASTPHFYNGDPEYWHAVNGLSPDKNRHETFIDIEPYTGLAMNGGKKIQINIQVHNYSKVPGFEKIPTMLYPIVYTNETARIDQAAADKLNSQLEVPLKLMSAGTWLLVAAGALLLLVTLALAIWSRKRVTTV